MPHQSGYFGQGSVEKSMNTPAVGAFIQGSADKKIGAKSI
jgi:hypothetical protein